MNPAFVRPNEVKRLCGDVTKLRAGIGGMADTASRRNIRLDARKRIMKVIFGTDPIKFPLTGIGRYAYELPNCLQESSEIFKLLFLQGVI